MARYPNRYLVVKRDDGPLWRKPFETLVQDLDMPASTVRAACYGRPVGVALLGAARYAGYSMDENFTALPRADLDRQQEAVSLTKSRIAHLPMRLSDIPNAPVPDLLGRRDINDAVGSFSGVWGVMTEHGYAVTRMPHDGSFRMSASEDTGGDSMCDGLAVPAGAPEAAYGVLERRFPGLKATPKMREKRIILSDPSYLKAFNRDYGQTVEWTD